MQTSASRPPDNCNEETLAVYLKQLCSDVTLQSNKEGFFAEWVEQVKKEFTDKNFKEFAAINDDLKRIAYVWNWPVVRSLNIKAFYTGKNDSVSSEKRREGNDAYKRKNDATALKCYSQAVVRASDQGNNLSLAYANRSAVLFKMGHYELSLQDMDLTLQDGKYPLNLRYKILERRGQCLLVLKRPLEALNSFKECQQALITAELEGNQLDTIRKNVENGLKKCSEIKDEPHSNKVNDDFSCINDKENILEGPSTALPHASSCVEIQQNKKEGRFVVANKDIKAGVPIAREEPFSSVLLQEKNGLYCTHCYKKLISLIPCPICSCVTFCSLSCREEALCTYHQYECQFSDLLKASGMALNCYLALRILTERGLDYFMRVRSTVSEAPALPSESSPHSPSHYNYFYHLVALEEQRLSIDFLQRTLMAVFLLRVLRVAAFFPSLDTSEIPNQLTENELFIGSLLLRHLQVIQFNAHEVSGFVYNETEGFKKSKSIFLGLAVYPTLSFFNHSCFPTLGRYFNGKKMTLVTLRPIGKGEQIHENYGPIFTNVNKRERQRKLLSRYWFKCNCLACEEDWPIYDRMPDTITLKCHSCQKKLRGLWHLSEGDIIKKCHDVTCNICATLNKTRYPLEKMKTAKKEYEKGIFEMDSNRREDAITAFTNYVERIFPLAACPIKELHLSMQSLRLLIASKTF